MSAVLTGEKNKRTQAAHTARDLSARVTEREKLWMECYARLHGANLSDAIKEWQTDPDARMYSHQEVGKMLGFQ